MEKLKNIVKETLIIEESIEKQKEMTQEIKEKNDENIKIVLAKLEAFMDKILQEVKPLLKESRIDAQIKTEEFPINIVFFETGWALDCTSRYVQSVNKQIGENIQWKSDYYYATHAHYILNNLENEVVASIEKKRSKAQENASKALVEVSKASEELNKSLDERCSETNLLSELDCTKEEFDKIMN